MSNRIDSAVPTRCPIWCDTAHFDTDPDGVSHGEWYHRTSTYESDDCSVDVSYVEAAGREPSLSDIGIFLGEFQDEPLTAAQARAVAGALLQAAELFEEVVKPAPLEGEAQPSWALDSTTYDEATADEFTEHRIEWVAADGVLDVDSMERRGNVAILLSQWSTPQGCLPANTPTIQILPVVPGATNVFTAEGAAQLAGSLLLAASTVAKRG